MRKPLSQLIDDYLAFCLNTKALRPATIKSYREVFRQFRALVPEAQHVDDLTPTAVDAFFQRLMTRQRLVGTSDVRTGVKPSTLRAYGSKLHSFFDWLCARGHLTKNPVERGQLPRAEYTDQRALKREEVDRILSAIVQCAPNRFLRKRNLAMVAVFLFAGLRRTELLSLKVHDLDLDRRTLTVRGETSKSKFTRCVPLAYEAVAKVEDYLQERRLRGVKHADLWVGSRIDRPFTKHGLKHLVKKLRERSGINFHVHRFRHTYACMLGRNNVSAVKIQKLLGHTDLRMTQTYLRSLGVDDMRDSVQFLSLENLPRI